MGSPIKGPDVIIGDGCKIQNNVSVYKGVTLEADVFCGPSMMFANVFNPRAHVRRMDEVRPALVRKGASLGANCTIVCGVTIGKYALVGAGAVVTKDVPDYALVVGNPARQSGWMCECGEKLGEQMFCEGCKKDFQWLEPKNDLMAFVDLEAPQYSVLAKDGHGRDYLQARLKEKGVPTAVYYPTPLHLQTAFSDLAYKPGDLPVSEDFASRIFSLPMHPYLTLEEQKRVSDGVR